MDHKPLTFALNRLSDAWSARQLRQLAYIAEFTSDMRHVPGAENVVADSLSRPAASVLPTEKGHVDLKQLASQQQSCQETQSFKDRPNVQSVQLGGLSLLCDSSPHRACGLAAHGLQQHSQSGPRWHAHHVEDDHV